MAWFAAVQAYKGKKKYTGGNLARVENQKETFPEPVRKFFFEVSSYHAMSKEIGISALTTITKLKNRNPFLL